MFDVGFSELIVIALVALIVIGPERLPRVARTLGVLLGRAQRYVNDVKVDIQREVNLDELKNIQSSFQDAAKSIEQSVTQVEQELQVAGESVSSSISAATDGVVEAAAPAPSALAPAAAGVEAQTASAQMDLGLESTPAAGPAPIPKT